MKKNFLLIIPIIFFLLSLYIRSAQGPYYFSMRYDPSYVYLISSLNLEQGFGVGHKDHPGTPVQLIGALVIKFMYTLGDKNGTIVESVFEKPEEYLKAIEITFIIINSIGIFLMGLVIYNITNNIFISYFLQFSPLFCFISFDKVDYGLLFRLFQISPENFLIFILVILIALLFKYIYEKDLSNKKLWLYTVAFALICGTGAATKILIIPVFIIPFILIKGIHRKIIFSILSILFFIIIVFPTISYPSEFVEYLINTVIKSGRYGKGNATIIDPSVYYINFMKILNSQIFFFFIFGISCLLLFYSLFNKKKSAIQIHNQEIKLLMAINLSNILNLVIISKNYYQHYILTSIMFLILSLYLIIAISKDNILKKFNLNKIFIIAISCILIFTSYNCIRFFYAVKKQYDESTKIMNFIDSYKSEELLILSFGATSPELALAYATVYGASQIKYYKSVLAKKSTNDLFYEIFGGKLYSLGDPVNSYDTTIIREKLFAAKKILFMSRKYVSSFDQSEAFIKILENEFKLKNCKLTKLFSNDRYESVYELSFDKN